MSAAPLPIPHDLPTITPDTFNERPVSLTELLSIRLDSPKELVEDFIFEGESLGLVGRPKLGKTRIAWDLALSVASGTPFFGMRVPAAKNVLYVDIETPPDKLRERLLKIAGEERLAALLKSGKIASYCPDTIARSKVALHGEGFTNLCNFVNECQPSLLILDNYRLLSESQENEAQAIVKDLRKMSELKDHVKGKLTTILVHHLRKTSSSDDKRKRVSLKEDPHLWLDSVSGSAAFVAHLDGAYGLDKEDSIFVLSGIRRSGPEPLLLLESDQESLRFQLLSDKSLLVQKVFSPSERTIWERLPWGQPFSWSEALEIAGGPSKKSTLSAIKKAAIDNNLLRQNPDRTYQKVS